MSTSNDSLITFDTAQKLGLNQEEFDKIHQILGRAPNFTELSIFSVMWSEHCSYKNSIKYLKTLPRDGDNLLVGAGEENAGLVDIGDGWACAFKIESHNHPSAIEPYQGAATGVGGIHRDIFTMGARPIAAMNSLRFGNLQTKRTKHLMSGVVKGIGDYGNCLGVPTVGGETYFNECYEQNILVNAMSIGVVKNGETVSAISEGVGNPVFIVGSATGKDGIHGATFASADLHESSAEDLPSVQVGDPFQEKLLLEATLEAIKTGVIVGMQDMGAAGITCSTSEMSAKGNCGMRIDLNKVPTRQNNMVPFEILLSESQERMLVVCEKGQEQQLLDVYDKWDLACEQIGEVTEGGMLEFFFDGERVAYVPADDLVLGGGAPVYDREYKEASYYKGLKNYNSVNIPAPEENLKVLLDKLVQDPNVASKRWIYEQYDHTVRLVNANTMTPSDASIIRVPEADKVLLSTVDCNATYVYADPEIGTQIAVAEAARNIVCSGGKPLAITNCLNFGNPYNPEVYWQFVGAINGMGRACRAFNTPVTGGNVSFYNHTVLPDKNEPVHPTPTIGMIGQMDDLSQALYIHFVDEGDSILLIGQTHDDLNRSRYLEFVLGISDSKVPSFNLDEEIKLHDTIRALNDVKLLKSAHDVSDGGLIVTLLESAISGKTGFELTTLVERPDVFLFSEAQGRVVVSCSAKDTEKVAKLSEENGVPAVVLGTVTKEEIKVNTESLGAVNYWYTKINAHIEKQMNQ